MAMAALVLTVVEPHLPMYGFLSMLQSSLQHVNMVSLVHP
jgi:hypothetical protein